MHFTNTETVIALCYLDICGNQWCSYWELVDVNMIWRNKSIIPVISDENNGHTKIIMHRKWIS